MDHNINLVLEKKDYEEILNLQKLAYQTEAEIYNDYYIPPLMQTLDEFVEEASQSTILKYTEHNFIIGSVRAYQKNGTCYIGKLIVHPDYRNKGIGKKLLAAIEEHYEGLRYELFTGNRSEKNLAIYEKAGYRIFKIERVNESLSLVYLEKLSQS